MAHEINNPLGGLINAVDTLKAHGQTPGVRDASIRLVERGLAGIRDVVEAALATYRPERSRRPLAPDDLEDVKLLLQPELRRKRQRLDWDISWMAGRKLRMEGGPIRQAVLNLLLNASAATPEGGLIWLKAAGTDSGWLEIDVSATAAPGCRRRSPGRWPATIRCRRSGGKRTWLVDGAAGGLGTRRTRGGRPQRDRRHHDHPVASAGRGEGGAAPCRLNPFA
jgi:hypothetical protein